MAYPTLKAVLRSSLALLFLTIFTTSFTQPQATSPGKDLYSGLRWRMIGPFRGGRTVAVSGVSGQPNVYYFGGVGGGVWKTTNGGITWEPIFDNQPIASIGALAVAPSDPNVIYVGTGEPDFRSNLTYGNGIYKSTDAGKTWKNIGLPDTRHIARIVVDPKDANRVLVASPGHAYGPNAERGVFRSTDGGATWQKVLYKDENTGAIDLAIDPDHPQLMFAALVNDRRPAWSVYAAETTGGAIYKSTDGGTVWNQITGGGLPQGNWGRVGLAVARGTFGQRVYALIDNEASKLRGLYSSDDGGQTWGRVSTDRRLTGRAWYFGEVVVDPKRPDTVYLPNVAIYRSTDAGHTFAAIKGAPGGDDYHALWIDPSNPDRMIFGSDQGASVSVDGGGTWSSWYNQPTGQFYHVSVDNQFPYHIYGAQQDSGSIDIASRGPSGAITFRDWSQPGAGESGYIAPDPSDPDITYGGGPFGELFRHDRKTDQNQVIAPDAIRRFGDLHPELRFTWTSPLAFSPQDPHTLYFGAQYVLRTTDQGRSWQRMSPDLTGAGPENNDDSPITLQNAKARGKGMVYTIAPSAVAAGEIWVGTDTGLVHLTRDGGKSWSNVTPPGLSDYSKISLIDASHFEAGTAYAAVDRHRLDDIDPFIYRTHDFGKTWTKITNGIPSGAYVRAVREDTVRKGLLFAGTELGVCFSLDDGDSWHSLQTNMPVAPVHDLVVKDNDLVAATHGRAFWVLDDISPLRQLNAEIASSGAYLFAPAAALRIRASTNHDTPLPPEEPAGENPPPGAVLYYYLKSGAQSEVKLEVLDSKGQLLRSYSSKERPWRPLSPPAIASYWFHPQAGPSAAPGMHRFTWDLRYAAPMVTAQDYTMSTAYGMDTPRQPGGATALPGNYSVRLIVDGKSYTQPLKLGMDPRVKTSTQDLEKLSSIYMRLQQALTECERTIAEVRAARNSGRISAEQEKKIAGARPGEEEEGSRPTTPPLDLGRVARELTQLLVNLDSSDTAPATQESNAADSLQKEMGSLLKEWTAIKSK